MCTNPINHCLHAFSKESVKDKKRSVIQVLMKINLVNMLGFFVNKGEVPCI